MSPQSAAKSASKAARKQPAIEVLAARTHNLKAIDCHIPHGKVTVVTGPSGAGKSSLAFDTVYAEAQRRYAESLSTYVRQFLEQMERPPVDAVRQVLPAVALEAKNSVKNARSTVGTLTEVQDVLRLLFTHLGEVSCPEGHGAVGASTSQEAAERLAAGEAGQRFLLLANLPRPPKQANEKLRELVRQGYGRMLQEEEIVRLTPSARWPKALDPLPLVVGRYRAGEVSARLAEAVEEVYRLTGGRLEAQPAESREASEDGDSGPGRLYLGRGLTCSRCGTVLSRPTPPLFSFNSPLGACTSCQGFGRVIGVDPERVIPDPSKSLRERPIAPWNSPSYEDRYDRLYPACRERGIDLDRPWQELSKADRDFVWRGRGSHTSVQKFFDWLERRSYKMHVRVLLARYRAYEQCTQCEGRRLKPDALAVTLQGKNLAQIAALSVEQLRAWLQQQAWSRPQRARAGHLLEQLEERVDTLYRVGLDYLTLDRQARTLSGGEAQRIQLAAALGCGLTSTLYVLDEPTVGLHPQDSGRLLELLQDLASRGNTVLVVEHDRTLIEGADHVIDLGPLAGERGGELMAEGPLAQVLACEQSLTARYLAPQVSARRQHMTRRRWLARTEEGDSAEGRPGLAVADASWPSVGVRGARANNLKGFDLRLPLGAMTAVTGVSGSGKSTLVENVIHGTYQRSRGVVDVEPGDCLALDGFEQVADVVLVDQKPLGRSSRSNPVTYVKAYDEIRKLFAGTPDAQRRGISAGHFSFNLERGRCPQCQGTGTTEVDMQFMAAVSVTCDSCQGHRFLPEVLAVTWQGRNIHETLELTVDAGLELFAEHRRLVRRLQALQDVGLGYLRLGQATSTLSGGEAQRLKLASYLDRSGGKERRLFLFDEPTTGLHLADIDLLARTFRRLTARGHGVVVVEHSPDLIAEADWILDLGPGGGEHGGQLLDAGPLVDFLDRGEGPTAVELRRHLSWRRSAAKSRRKVGAHA